MSVVSQLELCLFTARPKEKKILIGVNIIVDAKIEKVLQIMIHPTAELCISQYQFKMPTLVRS
jgi:hypothetical protein